MRMPGLAMQVRMVPRFAVEQGTKEDGSRKLRAVDHMSWAARSTSGGKRKRSEAKKWSTNGCTSIPERIRHDHLDFVEESGRLFHETTGEVRAHLLKYIHPHVSAFMLRYQVFGKQISTVRFGGCRYCRPTFGRHMLSTYSMERFGHHAIVPCPLALVVRSTPGTELGT